MRRAIGLALLAVLVLALPSQLARAGTEEIDYATYDARVTDVKGVVTDVKDFGYTTGVNILLAYRGEADVEIPFRLIRSIELGEYVPETRRASCTVTLRTGKAISLEIDAIEGGRLLSGKAEFGEYRIRMGKIRRLDLVALSHTGRGD